MLATVGRRRQAPDLPSLVPALSQRARRTATAAVPPRMARPSLAQITGMRVFDDELDQRPAAQVARELPSRGLVDPHERRFDREAARHAERKCDLRRLDG